MEGLPLPCDVIELIRQYAALPQLQACARGYLVRARLTRVYDGRAMVSDEDLPDYLIGNG